MRIEASIPEELIQLVRNTQHMAVLTGAGISAESGVPTFREAQTGLWANFNPQDLATPQAFQRMPETVWKWYAWRRQLIASVEPNPGHFALAILEQHIPDFTLITQNVDGLHQCAKSGEHGALIELHGNIQRTICSKERTIVMSWQEAGSIPPLCPHCGAYLRPDVVWFGESLPAEALQKAWEAASRSQVFLSIGTSGIVEPAASLPWIAHESGAVLVEINPQETSLTRVADNILQGPSGVILPELVKQAWPETT